MSLTAAPLQTNRMRRFGSSTPTRLHVPHATHSIRRFASSASIPPAAPGHVNFLLADIGEGITECELLKWHCAIGDSISQFDKICEVQSDKANVEITSRYDGVVTQLNYKVGQLAKVGQPLCVIRLNSSASASTAKSTPTVQVSDQPVDMDLSVPAATPFTPASIESQTHQSSDPSVRVLTSPAVRRIAKESNIDLHSVKGSGPNGRVTRDDVMRVINGSQTNQATASGIVPASLTRSIAPAASDSPVSSAVASTVSSPAVSAHTGSDVAHPITGLARIMVQTMSATASIPLFGYTDEVRCDALHLLRQQLKPVVEKMSPTIKLSYMPFLIKACSLALSEYPQLNAHVNADCSVLTHRAAHNIGIAVDTPRGLLVPNIKNVQALSVADIAAELQRISSLAAHGKLGRSDLQGGTFTLSNIGSIGGRVMSPIVVVPEVVICALGAMFTQPRCASDGKTIEPHRLMNLCFTADHRVVDGATLARFSNKFKSFIEQPQLMMLQTR